MRFRIERTGGLAGFGSPASRVKSVADVELDELAPADRTAVEALFRRGPREVAPVTDGFVYRLTRGAEQAQALEDEVPSAVLDRIQTQID